MILEHPDKVGPVKIRTERIETMESSEVAGSLVLRERRAVVCAEHSVGAT